MTCFGMPKASTDVSIWSNLVETQQRSVLYRRILRIIRVGPSALRKRPQSHSVRVSRIWGIMTEVLVEFDGSTTPDLGSVSVTGCTGIACSDLACADTLGCNVTECGRFRVLSILDDTIAHIRRD